MTRTRIQTLLLASLVTVPVLAEAVSPPATPGVPGAPAAPWYVDALLAHAETEIAAARAAALAAPAVAPGVASAHVENARAFAAAARDAAAADEPESKLAAATEAASAALDGAAAANEPLTGERLLAAQEALAIASLAAREAGREALLATPERVWTSLNMGAGSGLDADTLDGLSASDLLLAVEEEALARLAADAAEAGARAAADAALAARAGALESHVRNGAFAGATMALAGGASPIDLAVGSSAAGSRARLAGAFSMDVAKQAQLTLNDANFGVGAGRLVDESWGWTSYTPAEDSLYLWSYDGQGRSIRFMTTSNGTAAPHSAAWRTNMIVRSDGRVGIGQDHPGEKLEVAGNVRLAQPSGGGNAMLRLAHGDASGYDSARIIADSPSSLRIDGDGNPSFRVAVDGSVTVTGGKDLALQSSPYGVTDPGDLVFADGAGLEVARVYLAYEDLALRASRNRAADVLVDAQTGNVAIGGWFTPGAKLDVAGSARIAGPTTITNGNDVVLRAPASVAGDPGDLVFASPTGEEYARAFMLYDDFAIRANKARAGDLVIDSQTGNVGIGAGPGAARLTVGGTVSASALALTNAGLPTCDASARGQMRFVSGTTNADALFACLRSATGSYGWKAVAVG